MPKEPTTPTLDCKFFKTEGGNEPVRDWLFDQPAEVRKKIGDDIRVVQYRWPLGRPLVGVLGGGLFEVRTSHFDNDYRVYFSISEGKILLLHGAQKPVGKAETALAMKRKDEADADEKARANAKAAKAKTKKKP
jgi:phage-related protein